MLNLRCIRIIGQTVEPTRLNDCYFLLMFSLFLSCELLMMSQRGSNERSSLNGPLTDPMTSLNASHGMNLILVAY